MSNAPTLYESMVASLFHCYPLVNGCGTVANTGFAKALIPANDRKVWAKVGNRPCFVPLNDLIGRAIFLCGELDRKVGRTIKRYVSPGDIVLDVGANLGLVSLQMASKGADRILAFEPNPAPLKFLDDTLSANAECGIELHKVALGRANGQMPIDTPVGNMGRASLDVDPSSKTPSSTVPVVKLSDLLVQEGVDRVDFMKIDVEGFEAQVLEGLFCGAVRPKRILFEEHEVNGSKTVQLLHEEGYVIRGLSAPHHISLAEVSETDPLFPRCRDFLAEYKGSAS